MKKLKILANCSEEKKNILEEKTGSLIIEGGEELVLTQKFLKNLPVKCHRECGEILREN